MIGKINTALLLAVLGLLVYGFFLRPQPGRYKPLGFKTAVSFRATRRGDFGALLLDTATGTICDGRTSELSSAEMQERIEDMRSLQESYLEEYPVERYRKAATSLLIPTYIPFCSDLR